MHGSRNQNPPGAPAAFDPQQLRRLSALVATDRRTLPATATGSRLCAFVTREREAFQALHVERTAVVVVCEGFKCLGDGPGALRLGAGRAAVLAPGWRGDVVNEPCPRSGCYRALFIDFPEDLVARARQAHPAWRPGRPREVLDAQALPLTRTLLEAVLRLAEAVAPPTPLPAHMAEHRAMELLLWLADDGWLPRATSTVELATADAVRALLRWKPAQAWTAERIARELRQSPATLRRRLRSEGVSLRALKQTERLGHARALIEREGCSVAEAAWASGYASRSGFSRRFKQAFGAPPSDWPGAD